MRPTVAQPPDPDPPPVARWATRLDRSPRVRSLMLAALTLVAVVAHGYHFGTFDQAIHIPFLKAAADPSLFPGDRFVALRHTHYSVFWFAFIPALRIGVLEPTLFAVHLATTWLTLAMIWTLARRLWDDPTVALVAVVAFLAPHLGFAGFTVLEFSVLNRTFAFPFLLGAIVLHLDGRTRAAFAVVGLVFNVHAISAAFVLALLGVDAVARAGELGPRRLTSAGAVVALAASPVLAWRLAYPGETSALSLQPAWFDALGRGLLANVFWLTGPPLYVSLLTACGLGAIVMFVRARRAAPPDRHAASVTRFVAVASTLVVLEAVVGNGWPVTVLIQFQVVRAGVFALLFGYLCFAALVARRLRAPPTARHGRADTAVLAAALVALPVPFGVVAVDVAQRLVARPGPRLALAVAALGLSGAVAAVAAGPYHMWSPGIHVHLPRDAWVDVQLWARERTSPDTVFVTPPDKYWLYTSDWRVMSERSTVSTLSEVLEMAFEPGYLDVWRPRFEAVAPGAFERFRGDARENQRLTAAAYDGLTDAELAAVAARYGAAYAVVERPRSRGFPVAYANAGFTVYAVR